MADNQPAIAITDHGNMFGVFNFVAEAAKHNKKEDKIKAIVGCEFYKIFVQATHYWYPPLDLSTIHYLRLLFLLSFSALTIKMQRWVILMLFFLYL